MSRKPVPRLLAVPLADGTVREFSPRSIGSLIPVLQEDGVAMAMIGVTEAGKHRHLVTALTWSEALRTLWAEKMELQAEEDSKKPAG